MNGQCADCPVKHDGNRHVTYVTPELPRLCIELKRSEFEGHLFSLMLDLGLRRSQIQIQIQIRNLRP